MNIVASRIRRNYRMSKVLYTWFTLTWYRAYRNVSHSDGFSAMQTLSSLPWFCDGWMSGVSAPMTRCFNDWHD